MPPALVFGEGWGALQRATPAHGQAPRPAPGLPGERERQPRRPGKSLRESTGITIAEEHRAAVPPTSPVPVGRGKGVKSLI